MILVITGKQFWSDNKPKGQNKYLQSPKNCSCVTSVFHNDDELYVYVLKCGLDNRSRAKETDLCDTHKNNLSVVACTVNNDTLLEKNVN